MQEAKPDVIKVIVSHDVDHLYPKDHWLRDLFFPKLWVRTTMQLIKKKITCREWWLRITSCFRKTLNNLDAIMDFDEAHGIQSTFFFGMNQGLGMSYRPEEAKSMIMRVSERGFSVGVHGIEYKDMLGMKKEYDTFKQIAGFEPSGIRMHYVRFDEKTFDRLSEVGYAFDTTEFDKPNCGTRKAPYKVGNMWEFPLAIMDSYLPEKLEAAKQSTLKYLEKCSEQKLQYVTVLFHDYQYCKEYNDMMNWYEWLMEYFEKSKRYAFASYESIIQELGVYTPDAVLKNNRIQ